MMKRRAFLLLTLAFALFATAAGSALATAPNNEPGTYVWDLEVPNVAMAPNGDTVAVTGVGTFSVQPTSATGGGEFTHTFAGGGSLSGDYTVTDLIAFQPYGCGVLFGDPSLPDNLCGGRLEFRVALTPDGSPVSFPGVLTIYCLIGNPPASAEEGIRLVVPGVINFNDVVEGENVYIKQ